MKICKLVRSRNNWKAKAKARGAQLRGVRKGRPSCPKPALRPPPPPPSPPSPPPPAPLPPPALRPSRVARIPDRAWCVLLVVLGRVSFRAVPRLLQLAWPGLAVALRPPHFTSVIHWTLRAGIALFQQVAQISEPWLAILDCSISIGPCKALVVLRVSLSALAHKGSALGPQDCQCIGLEVSAQWKGVQVAQALERIFATSGLPQAILKDGGADLHKGVSLFCAQRPQANIHTLEDIGHVVARALKALFATAKPFLKFLQVTAQVAARIRQTNLAWLLPPKIRTKGRFQGITKVAHWAQQILVLLCTQGRAKADSDLSKVRQIFKGLLPLRPFLKRFCATCALLERWLALLKKEGLNETTAQAARVLLAQLPQRSLVRRRLWAWLEKHLQIQRALALGQQPLLVSSDAIESLFGLFKTLIQRNPQAELNRLIYLLPLLCGHHSQAQIELALRNCSHAAMLDEIKRTVPQTLRQYRLRALKKGAFAVPKSGTAPSPDTGSISTG